MKRLALALLVAASAPAARAEEAEREDPARRGQERERLAEEPTSLPAKWNLLHSARKESRRRGLAAVQGSAWVNLGPTHENFGVNGVQYTRIDSGRVRQVVPHPVDPGTLYLSTSGGGVWKTIDGAQSWFPITDQLGALAVGALALDPAAPDILYLGFGDPFDEQWPGLVVSKDGGASWGPPVLLTNDAAAPSLIAGSVRSLIVDPQNSGHLFAGADVGLFESKDAGTSFALVALPGAAGAAIWSIAWAGGASFVVSGQQYDDRSKLDGLQRAARDAAAPLGLWRTDDAGHTWQSARAGLPAGEADHLARTTLAAAPSTLLDPASARLFLLGASRVDKISDSSQRDVYRSEDGGRTWQPLGANGSGAPANPNSRQHDLNVLQDQAWYNQALAVDAQDANAVFVGGSETSLRSLDGGSTWEVMTEGYAVYTVGLPSVHPDFHWMVATAIPGAPRTLYAGNDGGLYRSQNATDPIGNLKFTDALNDGLVTHLAYDVACADDSWPSELQAFVIGGTQDNGTRMRVGNSTTFNEVLGGDGIGVAVTRAVSTSAGGTVPRLILASTGSGGSRVFKSSDGAQSFDPFASGLNADLPFTVRFARDADGATFLTYTAASENGIYRSSGGDWARVGGGFATSEGKPSALHLLGTHPSRTGVWAAVGDAGSVYVTHDAGAHWTTAPAVLGVNASRPMGVKGTSSVAFAPDYDPANAAAQTLYASSIATVLFDGTTPVPAGFGHAFKTTDGGQSWQPLLGSGDHALPEVPVQRVRVDPGDPQTLYVATDIGLYRSQDGGQTFDKLGQGLPLARVTELCFSGGSLKVSTYGRGFWQLDVQPGGNPAGVRGNGDTNHDLRIDGLDLFDLAAALGATQADASYRMEADLVGATNQIDDADLVALLARFGGAAP